MKITVLVDNRIGVGNTELETEHGLSFLIECHDRCLLFDMGKSGAFWRNAAKMGLDLQKTVGLAVLSHGHADHTGGLPYFCKQCPDCKVYTAHTLPYERYFSYRHGERREISPDRQCWEERPENFVTVNDTQWLTPDIVLVRNHSDVFPKPYGNRFLTVSSENEEQPDPFHHEYSLVVRTRVGWVVIAACSHHGALNILKSCEEVVGEKAVAFVGGFHMVDSPEVEGEVRMFSKMVMLHFPYVRFYTGHCTGESARKLLREYLPEVSFFSTGTTLEW